MGRDGTMVDYTIDSQYLNEALTVKVYKPSSFSPLYKYHVCIMQDGDDYMQLGRIATLSDRFHEDGSIENTIFVGIHYQDKYDRREKYHPDGEKFTAYMKFLVNEVVPLLDEELPTYHMGGSRALMGDSLGGTMALMTAVKYPNTFGKVIMQSPLVNNYVMEQVEESTEIGTIDIYHTIGTEETEVPTTSDGYQDFLTPNRKLKQLLEEKCSAYTYHELDGEHTWKFWQKDLKRALPTMFSAENQ
ncbi:alpha/beta hydrolase [Pontibacillus salicampi]|uniref:Alpha/beta hydrolase n=1 Tax=Pontibacillus salicampi TaxID=1449801 RepID=A0ABV6LQQ1_9BACI